MSDEQDRYARGGMRVVHRGLYRKIPIMRCVEGCASCCGPAPLSPWEAERLGIPGQVVTPVHPGTVRCVFHKDGGCSVYERRPFVCRLYGTTAVAPCERGRAPATPIPVEQAIGMVARFEQCCPDGWGEQRRRAVRETIEASGDEDEMAALDRCDASLRRAREALKAAGSDVEPGGSGG